MQCHLVLGTRNQLTSRGKSSTSWRRNHFICTLTRFCTKTKATTVEALLSDTFGASPLTFLAIPGRFSSYHQSEVWDTDVSTALHLKERRAVQKLNMYKCSVWWILMKKDITMLFPLHFISLKKRLTHVPNLYAVINWKEDFSHPFF